MLAVEWTLLHVLAVTFLATLVRSAFGFGEALIAVPLLALLIPVEEAVDPGHLEASSGPGDVSIKPCGYRAAEEFMRKNIVPLVAKAADSKWLDLSTLARVEVTSEESEYLVEF